MVFDLQAHPIGGGNQRQGGGTPVVNQRDAFGSEADRLLDQDAWADDPTRQPPAP